MSIHTIAMILMPHAARERESTTFTTHSTTKVVCMGFLCDEESKNHGPIAIRKNHRDTGPPNTH